ncbi:MAG: MipA/OmpV family protein [Limnohabitans sp.]
MKTTATFTLALAAAFAFMGNMAAAQDEPDVGAAKRPLWEAGVAGFALESPAYPGAADKVQRGLVLPYFVYRGPILRAGGGTFGARMAKTDDFEVDIGFAGSLSAMSDDITVRTGMPDLGFLLEFGPRVKYTLARPSANSLVRLEVPLRGVFEFQDGVGLQGWAFEPRITYDHRNLFAGVGVSSSFSLMYGDKKFNQYLYGVPAAYATAQRDAYDAKAGLISPRFQLSLNHAINKDVRVFGLTRLDAANLGVNSSSPLHVKNSGVTVGFGLVWTLGRSTRLESE